MRWSTGRGLPGVRHGLLPAIGPLCSSSFPACLQLNHLRRVSIAPPRSCIAASEALELHTPSGPRLGFRPPRSVARIRPTLCRKGPNEVEVARSQPRVGRNRFTCTRSGPKFVATAQTSIETRPLSVVDALARRSSKTAPCWSKPHRFLLHTYTHTNAPRFGRASTSRIGTGRASERVYDDTQHAKCSESAFRSRSCSAVEIWPTSGSLRPASFEVRPTPSEIGPKFGRGGNPIWVNFGEISTNSEANSIGPTMARFRLILKRTSSDCGLDVN